MDMDCIISHMEIHVNMNTECIISHIEISMWIQI